MPTAWKYVEVEVDLDDIDTDDLISELKNRSVGPDLAGIASPDDLQIQRQAMLRALWANDEAKAIDLLKTYLCDCLGRATI